MRVLITGGAGFIGRWSAKKFLDNGHSVTVFDDLSNGSMENIAGLRGIDFVEGTICNTAGLSKLFTKKFDLCVHMAAQINVQESLDNPQKAFDVNVRGTFNILEECKKHSVPLVLMSTCMIYDMANTKKKITESHPVKPASPYAGTKLAAEELALSYFYGYKLPVIVLRVFNTYGPYQKSNMEGGVVSIFLQKSLQKNPLQIFGDGTQTRDLLYVEDAADFVYKAATSKKAVGKIINAGSGEDISINELARKIEPNAKNIVHVPHHHPQSEIPKLVCDNTLAKSLLAWSPTTSLEEGIRRTREWLGHHH